MNYGGLREEEGVKEGSVRRDYALTKRYSRRPVWETDGGG